MAALNGLVGVFLLSSMPIDQLPIPDIPSIDKLAHTGLYGVLMVLWCLAVRTQWPDWSLWKTLLVIAILVTLYGVAAEYYQRHFVKGRSFSVWDMVANGVGAGLGAAAWWWWEARRAASRRWQSCARTPRGNT